MTAAALVGADLAARFEAEGDVPIPLFEVLDPEESKRCNCGTVFHRDGRSRIEFRARRSCSIACGVKAQGRAECPPRTCERHGCGQTIPRSPAVTPTKYRKVRFCSVACRSAQRREVAEAKVSAKTCAGCGATFRRRINTENEVRFAQRRFCSQSCGARNRDGAPTPAPLTGTKTCPVCEKEFHPSKGEHPGRWKARRCCSRSCAGRARIGTGRSAPKTCPVCSTRFERDYATATSAQWTRKVCCSETCREVRKQTRAAERRADPDYRPTSKKRPAPKRKLSVPSVAIPDKPPAPPRVVWRPGMGEDGTGELAPGFTREVNVWAGVRRG